MRRAPSSPAQNHSPSQSWAEGALPRQARQAGAARVLRVSDPAAALEVYGDVRDRDYYTFSVRLEAIEQAYLALLNNPAGMRPKG